ncbi:MAG: mRNA surveillance protein pelota [Candidatus Heimdallarchaeota archaeon]
MTYLHPKVRAMNIKSRKYQQGAVTLAPETIDDLYILYNIILPNDQVKARTTRRVRQNEQEENRASKGERMTMVLTVQVEEVSFHEFATRLRIKGKIIAGPEDLISFGTYHTLNVEIGTLLTIYKESWNKVDIERIEEAAKKTSSAKVIIVAIDDNEATIAGVSTFSSTIIAHFRERIPKKASSTKDKIRHELIQKFFAKVTFGIEEALATKFPDVAAIIIAGPGFTKDHFIRYLQERKRELKFPVEKILVETASCGGPSAISEIISKNILGKIIEEEQASSEAVYIEEVLSRLGRNTQTVAYGDDAIARAIEFGAVETLLIVDNQLRLRDRAKRKELDELLLKVRKNGGKIVIMSEQHESGKQVEKFGGKIALLRFPIQ